MAAEFRKLRVKHESGSTDTTTEIAINGPMSDGKFEFIIEQSVYDKFKKRHKPSKLVIFSLSTDELNQLLSNRLLTS